MPWADALGNPQSPGLPANTEVEAGRGRLEFLGVQKD